MKRLWAPWRNTYFTKKMRGCFFCQYLRQKKDRRHLILKRTRHSFSILNLYPYNNGHTMIVPRRHVDDLDKLTQEEREDLINLFIEMKKLCQKVLKAHGFNAGINFGRAAGAGVEGHLHFHLVPRWRGDTNFMPIFSETKVISQSLESLYRHLVRELAK